MGYIPDDIIDTVRIHSDIVEVVSRHVQLKRKGKNYTGLCPFHHERTPSFTVAPDKQFFYCFGCGAGGNVFKFLMMKENIAFYEAVSMLAERAGVVLPSAENPAQREKERRLEGLRHLNSLAKDYFYHVLINHESAIEARQYLAARGLTREILERFQLGFAPPGWSSLIEHLGKKGYRPQDLLMAGLIAESGTGRYYDRFRSRIMFPIWDAVGRVVGFGGRVLDGSLPKYLNTPETSYFSKGRLLYGLHLARQSIRETGYVLLMEGYMDVITAHQYGLKNAVASLGTALTADHVRLLMNYSRNVVIAFDADNAGVAATVRGLDILQEHGCQVRVVSVPDGKDPDEFLRTNGQQSWEDLVGQALPLIEYKLQHALSRGPNRTVADKLEVMRQVFPSLTGANNVEKEEGLKAVARVLNLSWETVAGEFKRFQAKLGGKRSNADNIANSMHNILHKVERLDARGKAEAIILRLILDDPSLGVMILDEIGERPFKTPYYHNIFKHCMDLAGRPGYRPEEIFNFLESEEQSVLSRLLMQDIPGENPDHILKAYIRSVNRCIRQDRKGDLLREIQEAERSGNHRQSNDLLRELMMLKEIDEAEKAGDHGRVAGLLQEYRQGPDLRQQ